jgi:hypothetical protein
MTELLAQLRTLEERLFACSSEELEQLLADDFSEIGSTGRLYDKVQAISLLTSGHLNPFTATDFSLRPLAPGLVLLSYRTDTKTSPLVTALRSSIWRLQGGKWQITFHQGTILPSRPEP